MTPLFRFAPPRPLITARPLAIGGVLSACGVLASVFALPPVLAQNLAPRSTTMLTSSATSSTAATQPTVATNLNVLIVAIEPLSPADDTTANPPNPTPATGNGKTTKPPIAPVAPPPIRPAASQGLGGFAAPPLGAPQVVIVAKKKQPQLDDTYRLEPEPLPPNYYPKGKLPGTADPAANPIAPDSAITDPAPMTPVGGAGTPATAPAASLVPDPFAPTAPMGLAQLAAAPLRRALTTAGYNDALDVTPDSPSITRAINARRLTAHTLLQLRRSLWAINQALAAAPAAAPVNPMRDDALAGAVPADANPARDGDATETGNKGKSSPLSDALLRPAAQAAARLGQALGYRAVIVLTVAPTGAAGDKIPVSYTMLVTDSLRETCAPVAFDGNGTDEAALNMGATTGASLVKQSLLEFPPVSNDQKLRLSLGYYKAAREQAIAGDTQTAQDLALQSLALNSSSSDTNKLLGDLLSTTDPAGAAQFYRKAVESNISDGETWGKIAISQTLGSTPDWPRAVQAGDRALQLGYDSAALRISLAVAQLNRARLYRAADPPRDEKADAAEAIAREHLDHAFALDPANADVVRLLVGQMITARQFSDAVRILDRLAPQYPDDADLQNYYAIALMSVDGRAEDAFTVWARAWRLAGSHADSPVDEDTYARLAEGFDRRADSIGGKAARLSLGVSTGAMGREAALLQLTKLQQDMTEAGNAIKSLQLPRGSLSAGAQDTRALAADLMDQALSFHRNYLETGMVEYQTRALEAHRQAIANLKVARAGV